MPRLIGQRVMLREYKPDDLSHIREWVNDAQTTRYMSTVFWKAQSLADSEDFLRRMMDGNPNAFYFVIADAADERYIGQLDLFRVDWRLRQAELGMVIASEADRSGGLGREALVLLEGFVFDTLGLERLELSVYMDNERALRCYRHAGFTLEGVKRHAYWAEGRFGDVGIMSVLRGEYEARTANAPTA